MKKTSEYPEGGQTVISTETFGRPIAAQGVNAHLRSDDTDFGV